MTTAYLIDDFIYQDTLNSLYNIPRAWITANHFRYRRVKNPHNNRRDSLLFYRPEIELYILTYKPAYNARLHLRMAKFNDTRGKLYMAALDQIENVEIKVISPPATMAELRKELTFHHKLNPHLGKFPEDWQPNVTDLFTFFRFFYTDYIAQINNFRNIPGAGDIWLKLRQKTDAVIMKPMTKLMDIEYAEREGIAQ